jgi:hypothetical protein
MYVGWSVHALCLRLYFGKYNTDTRHDWIGCVSTGVFTPSVFDYILENIILTRATTGLNVCRLECRMHSFIAISSRGSPLEIDALDIPV